MEYTNIALVFIAYINNVHSATIECTVNCAAKKSGSNSVSSLSSGGGGLMSAPVIGAPPDATIDTSGPPLPPFAQPKHAVDRGPSKEPGMPPPRLPPHIRACLEGKGSNCGRYARLNTEANRRRFLMRKRSRNGKSKSNLGASKDGREISIETSRTSDSVKGPSYSVQFKDDAQTSISEKVISVADSLLKGLQSTSNDKAARRGNKGKSSAASSASITTKPHKYVDLSEFKEQKSRSAKGKKSTFSKSISDRQDDRSKSFRSISRNAASTFSDGLDDQGKYLRSTSQKESSKSKLSWLNNVQTDVPSSSAKYSFSSSSSSSGSNQPSIAAQNIINSQTASGASTVSGALSGSQSLSDTSKSTPAVGLSSGPTYQSEQSLSSTLSKSINNLGTQLANTASSLSGMGKSLSSTLSKSIDNFGTQLANTASSLSGMGSRTATGAGSSFNGGESISAGSLSSGPTYQREQSLSSTSKSINNFGTQLANAASSLNDMGRSLSSTISKSIDNFGTKLANSASSLNGIGSRTATGTGSSFNGGESIPAIGVNSGSTYQSKQSLSTSSSTSINNFGTQSANAASSLNGIDGPNGKFLRNQKTSQSATGMGSSSNGNDLSSGAFTANVKSVQGTVGQSQVSSLGADQSGSGITTKVAPSTDKHNEDGSRGMNQDDSKGWNQDQSKGQVEVEPKQIEVVQIEIKQADISKPDEKKIDRSYSNNQDTSSNRHEEDGSRGQNQDGSQGKNQDQDNQQRNKLSTSNVQSFSGTGHAMAVGGVSQQVSSVASRPSASGRSQSSFSATGSKTNQQISSVSSTRYQNMNSIQPNANIAQSNIPVNIGRSPVTNKNILNLNTISENIGTTFHQDQSQTNGVTLQQGHTDNYILKPKQSPSQWKTRGRRPKLSFLNTSSRFQRQKLNHQGCSCPQTSQQVKPEIIPATAKLALIGERSVLIAKVPRAKIVNVGGVGSYNLEFPNLVIQPTLTETIASPSELFGMNMDKGTGSTDDSDILVVAMLPKGSTLGSVMFKDSSVTSTTNIDVSAGIDLSKLPASSGIKSQSGVQIPKESLSLSDVYTGTVSTSGTDVSKGSVSTSGIDVSKGSVSTSGIDVSKDSVSTSGVDVSASSGVDKLKDSVDSSGGKISVDTSKDDGKLKVKIQANKVKDSTLDAIKNTVDRIESDKISVDTSKDDGKLKIKIKAKDSQTPDLTSAAKDVLRQSLKDRDEGRAKVADTAKVSQDNLDTSVLKSVSKSDVTATKPELKAVKQDFSDTQSAVQPEKPLNPAEQVKQDITLSESKAVPDVSRPKITIDKSKDDGKVKYEIKGEVGRGDNKIKSEIKLTVDKLDSSKPGVSVEKILPEQNTITTENQAISKISQSVNSFKATVSNNNIPKTISVSTGKREEDGDQGKTRKAILSVGDNTQITSAHASTASAIKDRKIAEAVKVLQAFRDSQSIKQQTARQQRLTPSLPDTTYKLPVSGDALNVLSQKFSKKIKASRQTDNVDAISKAVTTAVSTQGLNQRPDLTTSISTSKKTPNLEALCLIYLGAFIDSIGYAPLPGHCHKLVQCFYLGGKLKAVARDCPAGMFWDQTMLLCRPPDDVLCFEDKCLVPGTLHYRRSGGCNCFYKCVDGISVPSCCPKGYRYDDDNECVAAFGAQICDDECETLSILSRELAQTSCPSLPDPMNKYGYLAPQYGGLRLRACPAGTVYSKAQCRCKSNINGNGGSNGSLRKQYRQCSAEFKVNFDDGFKDLSKGGLAFDHSHIFLRNGKAVFNGKSKMYIWGFQSRYLGKTFAIRMKVKVNRGAGRRRPEPIISNCGPNGDSSVEVVAYKGKLIFKGKTSDNPDVIYFNEDYDDDKWVDITYYYDGNFFGGSCNGRTFKQRTGGNLESRDNPLTIGLCSGNNGFHGEIDELEIFTACIPKDV